MGSLSGLSRTFARYLITRPIRPTITSAAPASISQCGNSNRPIAVLTVSNLLSRLQPELDQPADGIGSSGCWRPFALICFRCG
jgi:hypothetical protein